MSLSHSKARSVLISAFAARGIAPNLATLQLAQAVGELESGYGLRARNWGSVHAPGPPCQPPDIEITDTERDGTPYQTCLRHYDTHEDGAADMIFELMRRTEVANAMRSGDARLTAIAMASSATSQNGDTILPYMHADIKKYGESLCLRARRIAKALNEPIKVRYSTASGGSFAAMALLAALVTFALWRLS